MSDAAVPCADGAAVAVAFALAGGPDLARVAVGAVVFAALRLERPARVRITVDLAPEVPSIVARLAVAMIAIAPWIAHGGSAAKLLRTVPVLVALVLLGRLVAYAAVRAARRAGIIREPTIIIGTGAVGRRCADNLLARADYGLEPVGFVDGFNERFLPLPTLGDLEQLESIVAEYHVRRAVVAFGSHREHEMVQAMRACHRHGVDVYVVPRFFELGVCPEGVVTDGIWGTRLIHVRPALARRAARAAKRGVDIVVAGTALVIAAPLILATALAVRLSSPGPVLFRQARVGRDGRSIDVLKFRSMYESANADTDWTADDRVTPVGHFLRSTDLDELPQLVNVLRGDMSLIGPRPERSFFVEQFNHTIDGYDDRHRAMSGMSGWAQVHGLRGDTSIEDRVRFDNDYIEHWSFWMDLVIIGRTAVDTVKALLPRKAGRWEGERARSGTRASLRSLDREAL